MLFDPGFSIFTSILRNCNLKIIQLWAEILAEIKVILKIYSYTAPNITFKNIIFKM